MTHEKYRHEALRQFHEGTADRVVIRIDEGSGQIIDELKVETEPLDAAATVLDLVGKARTTHELAPIERRSALPALGTGVRRLLPMTGGSK